MTADNDVRLLLLHQSGCRCAHLLGLAEIMKNENPMVANRLAAPGREADGERCHIAISADRNHGSDRLKLIEHRLAANVAGVKNERAAFEQIDQLGIEEAVRI